MGDEKDKQPASPAVPKNSRLVAQAVPLIQRPDFLVSGSSNSELNCRTALLFPASAPLTKDAVEPRTGRAKPPIGKKRKGMTDATTLDLQAVWTHVSKPPGQDGAAVLVFLHGFYTFVTIDVAGACA